MYEEFFGLTAKPFELLPNPEVLYISRTHKKALNYLRYGITERAGFVMLTGDIGAGKTTIIRNIIAELDDEYNVSMVFYTRVSSEQLLSMINNDFGLDSSGKDKITLLHELNDFLIAQYAEGNKPIIIIDEAQNLSTDALEEVRLLSNLEGTTAKLLQVILVGQPELRNNINQRSLRQLRQRVSINCHLRSLGPEEMEEYILYRLECAGNREAVVFEPGAYETIYNYSKGVPRLINVCCDFMLLAAYVDGIRSINTDLAQEVVDDVGVPELSDDVEDGDPGDKKYNFAELLERITSLEQSMVRTYGMANRLDRMKEHLQLQNKALKHVFSTYNDHLERMRHSLEAILSKDKKKS